MVALRPSPNETVSATTLANCRPSPIAHSTAPDITTGKMPGRMLDQHHHERAEGEADEGRDEDDLDRSAPG